jgi:hypothetical protein
VLQKYKLLVELAKEVSFMIGNKCKLLLVAVAMVADTKTSFKKEIGLSSFLGYSKWI